MILYLDTSAIVAILTNEAASPLVIAWIDANVSAEVAISDWVVTEFSSALGMKMRTGTLNAAARAVAFSRFARMRTESLVMLAFGPAEFRAAAHFADQHELGLRAGDALHLAICARHGAALCTLDDHLAKAGPKVGVATTHLS